MKIELELFDPLLKSPNFNEWVIGFEEDGTATMIKKGLHSYTKLPIWVYIAEVEEEWFGAVQYWAYPLLFA